MLLYACGRYEPLYLCLVSIAICDAICLIKDILYTSITKELLNTNTEGKNKYGKLPKRSPSQIDERPT
jgi:hypothetical protein